jgi:hypothetical protein
MENTTNTQNDETNGEKSKRNTRSHNWVGTVNNIQFTDEEYLEKFKTIHGVKYFIGQREIAPTTGKEHIQFFIDFAKQVYWTEVQALLNKCVHEGIHFAQRRAKTKQQAREYCCKEKSRIGQVMEFGEFVEERSRNDLTEIIERVKQGATNGELLAEYPTQFFRYNKAIETVRKTLRETEYEDKFRIMETVYIYGSPRTGKTRYIMEKYGYRNVCRITIYEKWLFENYKGQPVVLFDEFDGTPRLTEMNDYLDGYPYSYRCRNEDRVAMNDKVFIISNLPLSAQYTKAQTERPKVYEAFCKRIKHIINWDNTAEREYFIEHGTSLPPKATPQQMEMIPVDDKNLPR